MATAMAMVTVGKTAPRWLSKNSLGGAFRNARRFGLPSAALSVLIAGHVHAAKWDLVPSFTADETYTDNARLAPSGQEHSDWITSLTPSFTLSGSGARARFNANYSPQL